MFFIILENEISKGLIMKKMEICLLIFICCSLPPKSFIINPEYNKMDYSDKKLGIYPITTEIMYLNNLEDFSKQFLKRKYVNDIDLKIATDTFSYYFIEAALNKVNKIEIDVSLKSEESFKHPMSVSYSIGEIGEEIDFKIPNLNKRERNDIPFVLILGRVEISKEVKEHENIAMNPESGNFGANTYKWKSKKLITIVTFIIWNYEKNEAVCYGVIKNKSLDIFSSKESWISLFKRIPDMVFSRTPFKYNVE